MKDVGISFSRGRSSTFDISRVENPKFQGNKIAIAVVALTCLIVCGACGEIEHTKPQGYDLMPPSKREPINFFMLSKLEVYPKAKLAFYRDGDVVHWLDIEKSTVQQFDPPTKVSTLEDFSFDAQSGRLLMSYSTWYRDSSSYLRLVNLSDESEVYVLEPGYTFKGAQIVVEDRVVIVRSSTHDPINFSAIERQSLEGRDWKSIDSLGGVLAEIQLPSLDARNITLCAAPNTEVFAYSGSEFVGSGDAIIIQAFELILVEENGQPESLGPRRYGSFLARIQFDQTSTGLCVDDISVSESLSAFFGGEAMLSSLHRIQEEFPDEGFDSLLLSNEAALSFGGDQVSWLISKAEEFMLYECPLDVRSECAGTTVSRPR